MSPHHAHRDLQLQADSPREALVIVVSTRLTQQVAGYEDATGPRLVSWLESLGFAVRKEVVADKDIEEYFKNLVHTTPELPRVIITTGGTGLSADDRTVDAVEPLLERKLPGIVQAFFAQGAKNTPLAATSRAVAGTIRNSFIMTLPGSKGAVADGITSLHKILLPLCDMLEGTHHHGS
ncbi:molybdopterin-binding protein [Corynebacterium caspium]|uniref:molybdopterin-binding protein n=1 Tax=Corynebacterium caspium TaxID=234828 RepID=UPI0003648F0B|nr:molybdopterin-binding protein [Corynebacterium caspium]WKD59472.1 Molybdenum cofactor biosynthesis protein B [Corynebacterium caspium DSM 44850]